MDQTYLPGKIRDRIQDLMKSRKVTQAELATRIGVSESSLSRFISGKTDKLGDENIIRIARVFNVSTDFLLGEVDTPDRMNYDISELGLSVQAARNLYTHEVNPGVVNALLENIVYFELRRKGYDVYIGKKDTKEIDFVAVRRDERIYVQVCRNLPEESDREVVNLFEIKDHYPKYVVTLDDLAGGNVNGVKIMHLADFLLSERY